MSRVKCSASEKLWDVYSRKEVTLVRRTGLSHEYRLPLAYLFALMPLNELDAWFICLVSGLTRRGGGDGFLSCYVLSTCPLFFWEIKFFTSADSHNFLTNWAWPQLCRTALIAHRASSSLCALNSNLSDIDNRENLVWKLATCYAWADDWAVFYIKCTSINQIGRWTDSQ